MMDNIPDKHNRYNAQNVAGGNGKAAPVSSETKHGTPTGTANLLGSKSSLAPFIISGLSIASMVAAVILLGMGMGAVATILMLIAAALCTPLLFMGAQEKPSNDDPKAAERKPQKWPHTPQAPGAVRNTQAETGANIDEGKSDRTSTNGHRQRRKSF